MTTAAAAMEAPALDISTYHITTATSERAARNTRQRSLARRDQEVVRAAHSAKAKVQKSVPSAQSDTKCQGPRAEGTKSQALSRSHSPPETMLAMGHSG